jgi:hypothetical protein
MNPIFNPDFSQTNVKLAWLLPHLINAKWLSGVNLIFTNEANFNLTPLGEQRLRELYHIQRILFPEFFGEKRKENDGPARAGADAAMQVIFQELNDGKFAVEGKEFLMAFARCAFKSL